MRPRLLPVADAVASIPSDSTVTVGGSPLGRQPMTLVREMVRQAATGLPDARPGARGRRAIRAESDPKPNPARFLTGHQRREAP